MAGTTRGLGGPSIHFWGMAWKGLAKGSDDMRSGTDTEVRKRGCGGKCRMKQGWLVLSEWLLPDCAAFPPQTAARLLSLAS